MKKLVIPFIVLAALLGYGVYSVGNAQAPKPSSAQSSSPATADAAAETISPPADIVLGDPSSPVEIIEYASFTCPHCASFHNQVLPLVKAHYIDTGKARLIFRDFPLDQVALQASVTARCVPQEKFHDTVNFLFAKQNSWIAESAHAAYFRQVALNQGAEAAAFESCFNNQDIVRSVAMSRLEGVEKYKVSSTPTIVVNGEVVNGANDYAVMKKALDEALAATATTN